MEASGWCANIALGQDTTTGFEVSATFAKPVVFATGVCATSALAFNASQASISFLLGHPCFFLGGLFNSESDITVVMVVGL